MKLNRKIIIPALTLLVGSALAGSVSSTLAWYQYSTRANVAYLGTSAGTSGNLQVRIKDGDYAADGDWGTQISYHDVDTFLGEKKLSPITTGNQNKDAEITKFYSNPIAGFGPLVQWKEAPVSSYVSIPLQFRFIERSRDNSNQLVTTQSAQDIYLTDLLIQNDYSNAANARRDMSSAIRVHFNAYDDSDSPTHVYKLASKNGGNTATVGQLDLDGDGNVDKDYSGDTTGAQYGFGEHPEDVGTPIIYGSVTGNSSPTQSSYSVANIKANTPKLGTTSATDGKYLNVVVTIWLEGWQELPKASDTDTETSSIWDYVSTIDSKFDVGMQFAAKGLEE